MRSESAFVALRPLMIQLGEGNVVLFGTKGSARTLARREFLTRNGHPFTYVDIDMDSCAGELMEKLAVRSGEIPVVYCKRRYVLRNPSIAELAACLDLNINVAKGVRDSTPIHKARLVACPCLALPRAASGRQRVTKR